MSCTMRCDAPRRLGDPCQPDFGRTHRQPCPAAARPTTGAVWDPTRPSRTPEPAGAQCGRRRSGDLPWAGSLHHAILVSEQARDRGGHHLELRRYPRLRDSRFYRRFRPHSEPRYRAYPSFRARPTRPLAPSDAPEDYIASMVRRIIGFRLTITRLEGKWKMSQNRSL
jgi:hypothetical protein